MIKSLTAREIFKRCPHVKKQLWGGEFWSDGYFASTVGKHGDENMISKWVETINFLGNRVTARLSMQSILHLISPAYLNTLKTKEEST